MTINKTWIISILLFILFLWGGMYLLVPRTLFPVSYSTLLYSSEGNLLGARIAPDGQWRFPATDSLPDKFITCLTTYEDRYFFYHPGIDAAAILRAAYLNVRYHRVVSGGSTLTMQLARLARGNRDRTVYEKSIEMCWALFLETTHSKKEILNLYASHAPFGGNVVGIETAAWRYFGRSASDLSWAESATLAVLPNSPALIHPGRNRKQLKTKRDKLLYTLKERNIIDNTEYELSCMEPRRKPGTLTQRSSSSAGTAGRPAHREYVSPHRYSIPCRNKPRNSSTVMPGNTAVPTISITWLPLSPTWKPEKSWPMLEMPPSRPTKTGKPGRYHHFPP